MRRDLIAAGLLWLLATLAAVAATYLLMDPFPVQGAEEAKDLDLAFVAMSYMAAPVFGLVVAAISYSVLRFRTTGTPTEDGPAITGEGGIPRLWVVLTSVLAVVVIIYPGLIGLAELREDETAEMEVNITGVSWQWLVEYPETGVRVSGDDELVLPADTRIRFNITALDVLHSFWVPAFRQKIDAVPGITTTMYVTTLGPGGGPTDREAAYRVQCAELCGLRHAEMVMPVRVVERDAFTAWLGARQNNATASAR